ncbi:DUF6520 family protein [Cellulophaga omnivescoria]|uniref:DUF6520 family protein n=1 Tax=Cellulophaga omnivescoria TaxID=1888890 RepID=UPI0009858A62|nr:DUF6520 family protein [Cellulophaga omnivescoria]
METKKLKLWIPVLAIIFAVTSAFTTSVNSNLDEASTINGYIDSPAPCMSEPIKCLPTGNNVCTNGKQQAFGKFNANDTTCPRVVYKN